MTMIETGNAADLSPLLASAAESLKASGIANPRMEAELIMGHVLGISREQLWVSSVLPDEKSGRQFQHLVSRRVSRVPLQYLTGQACFYSMSFQVCPGVFIPRPETELLVDLAVPFMKNSKHARMIDIGTGSGCIAIACAVHLPQAQVMAADISMDALHVARVNAQHHGVSDRVAFVIANGIDPFRRDVRVDLIVSNPPYIGEMEIPELMPEVLHEPRAALVASEHGMAVLKSLLEAAPDCLIPGGAVLLEAGYDQAQDVMDYARLKGYHSVESYKDLNGIERVVKAVW